MSNNPLVDSAEFIDTVKTTHFTGALAQNAIEEENIAMPTNWGLVLHNKAVISNITIDSDQNLDWEVQFYAKDTQSDTDEDTDSFITSFFFSSSDGKQNAGTGLWKYDANPAHKEFDYEDEDRTSEWHITLVNRSVTAKTAGAAGSLKVRFRATPIA